MPARTQTVDLSALDAAADSSRREWNRYRYYADLAMFASLAAPGEARATPVRCRKRPARKRCSGLLTVRRRDVPDVIEWQCPVCANTGQITSWRHSAADLRGTMVEPALYAKRVPVSVELHAALRETAWLDPFFVQLAYSAVVTDAGQVELRLVRGAGRFNVPRLIQRCFFVGPTRQSQLLDLSEILEDATEEEFDGSIDREFYEWAKQGGEAFLNRMLAYTGVRPPDEIPPWERHGMRLVGPDGDLHAYRIKVTLRGVRPPVWRRLIIPSDLELAELHRVLQTAMGWSDRHPHRFRVEDVAEAQRAGAEPVARDRQGVPFDELAPSQGSRVVYEYGSPAGWHHDVVVEAVTHGKCSRIRCIGGKRRCPPEDCGGPQGYAELRVAFADPSHGSHARARQWLGNDFDPEAFDVAGADAAVRQVRS